MLALSAISLGKPADVKRIEFEVLPDSGKISTAETAVLRGKFFGKKKKGFLGGLFGSGEAKESIVSSNDWKIEAVGEKSGFLSKPFRFQEENEKQGGFLGFVNQGLNAVSGKDAVLFTPNGPGKYRFRLTQGRLTKEVTVEVVQYRGLSQPKSLPELNLSKDPYASLASHHAPYIAQETWFNPHADYLTRFDYDGNQKGDDNWENLKVGILEAYVYYAVMETKTHWFLHYNFFHPRDYSDACVVGTCHENDNEGIILTIRKDGSEFGSLEIMETLAHNNVYTFSNLASLERDVHTIDGAIKFNEGSHPIVFIEGGGHGVYGSEYPTSFFDSEKMDFKSNTGVTYAYGKKADSPANANSRNVSYDLVPIEQTWWPKGSGETDQANETFEKFFVYQPRGGRPSTSTTFIAGSFTGRSKGASLAKPFWGWHDNRTKRKKVLGRGQWALDPAYAVSVNYKWPENKPVSLDYVYNPFLAIEPIP